MSLTVTYKDNKFSLVGKDGRTYDVSAAQQQQWQQTLNGLATQHGLKDAQDLLNKGTVAVPEAGDSQWRMATEAGIASQDINASVVALNEHIGNPDLIHTYRPGDLTPDFVMLPVPPEKPTTDTPPATPKPDTSSPEKFASDLLEQPKKDTRTTWINDYVKKPETTLDDVNKLLSLSYGNDSSDNRTKIVQAYVEKTSGGDRGKQIQTLKQLAEHDWKSGNGQSIDVDVDSDILAVAKKLGISREDVGTINEGVK